MGLKTKKGTQGEAAKHLARASALKKLQVSLADFRRLCILKGVYPRDPKRKLKGKDKTYYHAKDIVYLYHEPLLRKFRDIRAYERKYRRAICRDEKAAARSLYKQRPLYNLFHIVKERYPTVLDAIRDLDDTLSTVALFASLPSCDERSVTADVIAEATRLYDEFLYFASEKRLVRKVFCSIKGFYVQLKYLGQLITFLIPHQFPQELPPDVDFKVMLTFLEFYRSVLKTLNYKLFHMEELDYPPCVNLKMVQAGCRFLSIGNGKSNTNSTSISNDTNPTLEDNNVQHKLDSLKDKLQQVEDDNEDGEDEVIMGQEDDDQETDHIIDNEFLEDESLKRFQELSEEDKEIQQIFKGLTFYLGRETPRNVFAFLLKSCGADQIGWQGECSPIQMNDLTITHHILDRPLTDDLLLFKSKREFIQPQWILDSINNRVLLPVLPYFPGTPPPPHLSPFVDDNKEGYVPEQRLVLDALSHTLKEKETNQLAISDDEEEPEDVDEVEHLELQHQKEVILEKSSAIQTSEQDDRSSKMLTKKRKRDLAEQEENERRKALLSKKHKRLLDKIEFGKHRQSDKISNLHKKRESKNTQE